PSISHYELINQLTSGIDNQASITFIEGWNFSDLRQALNKNEHIKHMTMAESDKKILEFVGAVENHPEGLFYPDTYYFNPNTSDREILKRAYDTMQRKLLREWQIRDQGLPYKTPYDALIMASIIEKETGRSSERAMIAGVFLNRLRIGMRLQTDPTVIYGLGQKFDGNIRKADL
ncbi:MAG: endolytic transglycosylase MltG, partial [Methylophilaceae bacterium]